MKDQVRESQGEPLPSILTPTDGESDRPIGLEALAVAPPPEIWGEGLLEVGSEALPALCFESGRPLMRGQRSSQRSAWGWREGLGRKGDGSIEGEGLKRGEGALIESGIGEGIFNLFILV